MKLSEAMRLGAMQTPRQTYGEFASFDGDATCALGAAALAAGFLDVSANSYKAGARPPEEWRWVLLPRGCPACAKFRSRVDNIIIHLNNRHRWTRERIADWVETLEGAESSAATAPAETVTPA